MFFTMQKVKLECEMCDSKAISFMKFCNPEEVHAISTGKSCGQYKKGQAIFYEDNLPLGIYCITKGIVKITRSNNFGKEQILRFAKEGEFLGYRAVIAEEPLTATATCIDDVTACFIPRQVFLDLLQSNAEINKQMFKALCHDMGLNNEKVQSLAQKSVRERVAETILYLHQTFATKSVEEEPVIPISLPREDLANIVGTATETLIRLLSEFKSDKYIDFEGKRIKIIKKEALERISHATV